MHPVGAYLCKGFKDEHALVQQRVGNDEILGGKDQVIVKEDIKVDGPGAPPDRLLSSQRAFYVFQQLKQIEGAEEGACLQSHIDETGLVFHAPGLCFIV